MDLTKGSIWQLLRKVTIPASTGSLFQTFYNLVDTYFAGRISPEALARIAKSWPIYFIAIAVAVGIGAGTTALISNSIGAKEDRKASNVCCSINSISNCNFNFCNFIWLKFF